MNERLIETQGTLSKLVEAVSRPWAGASIVPRERGQERVSADHAQRREDMEGSHNVMVIGQQGIVRDGPVGRMRGGNARNSMRTVRRLKARRALAWLDILVKPDPMSRTSDAPQTSKHGMMHHGVLRRTTEQASSDDHRMISLKHCSVVLTSI